MMTQAITNCTIYSGNSVFKKQTVVVENGVIKAVHESIPGDATVIDLGGRSLAPGLIDIQINGGHQFYFSQQPTIETLHDITDSSLLYGTTHTLPCLISSRKEKIFIAIDAVRAFMQQHPAKGVLGMHLEGPFLNPEKCGAHNKGIIRKPTDEELQEIIEYGKGVIKMITIAPECFTDKQLQYLFDSGIIVSAGHSTMDYESAQAYFKKGFNLVTHLFNAMPPLSHREPGLAGAAMDNEEVYTPIILDGAHCHYAMARLAYRAKKEKLILLSDAAFLGRVVKTFEDELLNATLVAGYYRNKDGNLAGAAISMWEAVQNAVTHVQAPTAEALAMATSRVAAAIKMDTMIGKVEAGYPATFVSFKDDLTDPQILKL
jgi:N-acetylglucosamine-6-phosphate deacetylase